MKEFLKSMKMNEATMSRILGGLIILVVGIMVFNYLKTAKPVGREQTSSAQTEASESAILSEYTVKPGDSLWLIAEKNYGSGYKWTDIAAANKDVITNPSLIYSGTKITLPKIEAKTTSYTVVKGDNLWNIAARQCGSGFAWTAIAAQNSLANPRIIHSGNVLTISCPKG